MTARQVRPPSMEPRRCLPTRIGPANYDLTLPHPTVRCTQGELLNSNRLLLRIFVILAIFGLVSLLAMLGKPGFEAIRAVDAVHLIGTGMCFGGAVVALILCLRGPREG